MDSLSLIFLFWCQPYRKEKDDTETIHPFFL